MDYLYIILRCFLACVIVISIIFSLLIVFKVAEAETMYPLVSENGRVNIRYKPSTKSEIVGYTYFGDELTITGSKADFSIVEPAGEASEGYIATKYLTTAKPEILNSAGIIVSNGRVKIRELPNGKTISYINNGDFVDIFAVYGDWYSLKGGGFIACKCVILFK